MGSCYNICNKWYWHSIVVMAEAALVKNYRNSFLGSWWGVLQPAVYILVIAIFAGMILNQPRATLLSNLISGIPFWQFMTNTLMGNCYSLMSRESVLKKCYVSRTMFPIADAVMHLYTLFFSFAAMYGIYILYAPEQASFMVLLTPIVALPLIITVISASIAAAFVSPYIRDLPQFISVALNALYWSVPIIYPYSIVPEDKKFFFEINPLFILFRPIQQLVVEHRFSLLVLTKAVLVSIILSAISYVMYLYTRRNVIYYL